MGDGVLVGVGVGVGVGVKTSTELIPNELKFPALSIARILRICVPSSRSKLGVNIVSVIIPITTSFRVTSYPTASLIFAQIQVGRLFCVGDSE